MTRGECRMGVDKCSLDTILGWLFLRKGDYLKPQ